MRLSDGGTGLPITGVDPKATCCARSGFVDVSWMLKGIGEKGERQQESCTRKFESFVHHAAMAEPKDLRCDACARTLTPVVVVVLEF